MNYILIKNTYICLYMLVCFKLISEEDNLFSIDGIAYIKNKLVKFKQKISIEAVQALQAKSLYINDITINSKYKNLSDYEIDKLLISFDENKTDWIVENGFSWIPNDEYIVYNTESYNLLISLHRENKINKIL